MPSIVPMRLALLLAPLLLLGLAQPLAQSTAQAATVPVPKTRTFQAGIDPYGSYVGQSTCNGTAKPGVVHVKNLLNATYGPRTVGIVRSCTAGGTSEHKEGRALDWMISARVSSQKAQADAFIRWLLATDQFGNSHAMLRRMGVMYIIWNNKMWRAYDPGRGWTEYRSCLSTPSTGNDTTCHRDHVHVSFTWNGAYARTSLYTGSVPFAVSTSLSNSRPAVGDTIDIRGSVTPVVGAAGKRVSIKRLVGSESVYVGTAVVDASGGFTYRYTVPSAGTYRFRVFKSSESCGSSGCAYAAGTSNEVGFTLDSVVKARYQVTLKATPDLVPDGMPVLLSGTVTPSNISAGKRISLKRYNASTQTFDYVTSATVATDGTFSATVEPPLGEQRYTAYKPGDECGDLGCAYVAHTSAATVVQVLDAVPYSVTARASLDEVPVGGAVAVSGSVAPSYAAPGTKVSLRRIVGEEPVYVATALVDPTGRYRFSVTASDPGTHEYRVFKPSDDCQDGSCDFTSSSSENVEFEAFPIRPLDVGTTASKTVLLRQPTGIAATLGPSSIAAGNRVVVQKYANVDGVKKWQAFAIRYADAKGRVALERVFTTPGTRTYRFVSSPTWCEGGVCGYRTTITPSVSIKAVASGAQRFWVSAAASDTTPAWGQTVKISGRVSPSEAAAGSSVSLRWLKNGVPEFVTSAKVGADGRYSVSLRARGSGPQIYWIYKGAAGCSRYGCLTGADASPRITLKVG